MSINKAILVGNTGKDPEVRRTESGVAVASFSLATTEKYKDKNGNTQEQTQWHNIVCWRELAERVEKYVKKGQQLYVEGKITTRAWRDQEGKDRTTTEIVANNIQMLGRKPEGQQAERREQIFPDRAEEPFNNPDDGDLPF